MYYLQGIPEAAEVAVPVAHFAASQAAEAGANTAAAPASGAPNSAPLNMFPQVRLDFGLTFHLLDGMYI